MTIFARRADAPGPSCSVPPIWRSHSRISSFCVAPKRVIIRRSARSWTPTRGPSSTTCSGCSRATVRWQRTCVRRSSCACTRGCPASTCAAASRRGSSRSRRTACSTSCAPASRRATTPVDIDTLPQALLAREPVVRRRGHGRGLPRDRRPLARPQDGARAARRRRALLQRDRRDARDLARHHQVAHLQGTRVRGRPARRGGCAARAPSSRSRRPRRPSSPRAPLRPRREPRSPGAAADPRRGSPAGVRATSGSRRAVRAVPRFCSGRA